MTKHSELAEEILKVSRSWKPDGVNFPLTDEEKLALIDDKLGGVREAILPLTGGQWSSPQIQAVADLYESLKVN